VSANSFRLGEIRYANAGIGVRIVCRGPVRQASAKRTLRKIPCIHLFAGHLPLETQSPPLAYIVSKPFRRPAFSAPSEGQFKRETGLSQNSLPSSLYSNCARMKSPDQIPYYERDGSSLGFRSLAFALLHIADGLVKPSYGPKGHLRAIWVTKDDGTDPVETHPRSGTRYSFIETLERGRCYTLRRLDQRDDDGVPVSMRAAFLQVVADCTVP
jgi:hypothetical protein